jgi:hypothetical protein
MTDNTSSKPVGGSYSELRKLYAGTGQSTEIHHMPSYSSYKDITSISRGEGSSIAMDKKDHMKTASWGPGEPEDYRKAQKKLIADGKIVEAFEMDKADLRANFGNKYDPAISQAESYLHQKVVPQLTASSRSNNPDKLRDLKLNTSQNNITHTSQTEQKLSTIKSNPSQSQSSNSTSKPSRDIYPSR